MHFVSVFLNSAADEGHWVLFSGKQPSDVIHSNRTLETARSTVCHSRRKTQYEDSTMFTCQSEDRFTFILIKSNVVLVVTSNADVTPPFIFPFCLYANIREIDIFIPVRKTFIMSITHTDR